MLDGILDHITWQRWGQTIIGREMETYWTHRAIAITVLKGPFRAMHPSLQMIITK